jgi:hypothetical protein
MPDVRVLAPKSLRDRIEEKLRNGLARQSGVEEVPTSDNGEKGSISPVVWDIKNQVGIQLMKREKWSADKKHIEMHSLVSTQSKKLGLPVLTLDRTEASDDPMLI